MPTFFANNPFLRLIIPFLGGLVISLAFELNFNAWPVLGTSFLIITVFSLLKLQKQYYKYLVIISADIFLFFFAFQTVYLANPKNDPDIYTKKIFSDSLYTFLAVADEVPVEKEKFNKCHLRIRAILEDSSATMVNGNILGYFRRGTNAIKPGDELLIHARVLSAELPKNPFEFDYKAYLANNGIYHTFFADTGDFKIVKTSTSLNPIWLFGLQLKQQILQELKASGLSRDAWSICAALLTGYSYEIGEDVTQSFSHSGTLHVLSVSGLHTGLIYLCVIFIFDLFDAAKKYRVVRYVSVLLVLWSFALLAGFNAPVLRSVIMFSLLGFGKIFFRSGARNQLNILLVTGFLMLCYNPFYLADVGFQLSFLAVAGILVFQPWFEEIWKPEQKITRWAWQGTTTSFAATLATLPVTLYYFKQFPLWFFITNMAVVPATFLLLLLTVFALLKIAPIISFMNILVRLLIDFIGLFNSPQWGYIDNIDFRLFDTLILGVLLLFLIHIIYYRSYKSVLHFFLILIYWQLNSFFVSLNSKNKKLVAVYQIKKEAAACVKNAPLSIINAVSRQKYDYHIKPHLVSFNYSDTLQRDFNVVLSKRQNFLFLRTKGFWPRADFKKVTHLCVSNNFNITENDLVNFKNVRVIISDGTNNAFTKRNLAELCSKFDIALYDTQNRGAFIASL